MPAQRTIKVFIASPNDLAIERRAFKDVIDDLNKGFGRGKGVTFDPLAWEDTLATTGRRPQSVINLEVDACDVFLLVMWRRWGQKAADITPPASSYTEEEYHRAFSRFQKQRRPCIYVFFKNVESGQMADPGTQLKKVLAFRKKLEKSGKVLYRTFEDDKAFKAEIDEHLKRYAEDGCVADAPAPDRMSRIGRPSDDDELEKYRENLKREIKQLERLHAKARRTTQGAQRARARAKSKPVRAAADSRLAGATAAQESLVLAENAAKAALDGRIEEARQGFAKALDGTTNTDVLYLAFEFFKRIGELAEAERLLRRWLAISGPEAETDSTAAAYGNLGLILRTRGDLDGAEAMHRKSLGIEEKLGRLEGMASDYGNLGLILQTRGDLDGAEAMHRKALDVFEKLDRQEGMARAYGNLGVILQARGDLDGAEAMLRKALEIDEKLSRLEGVASHYGNLGLILRIRGDLDGAEAMHRKALDIDEKLGGLEGIASDYGNLGVILQARGDLDGAEAMHGKSLAIEEKLGRLEGMAADYSNLGAVKAARGDLKGALELWSKSRDLYAKLGARHEVERVQRLIDSLPK
jgi:tetratricopeptide (TPR) repeat protein